MHFLTNRLKKLVKVRSDYYDRYAGQNDEYGFDIETFAKCEPFFRFMYQDYFQVQTLGLENIPAEGQAVLVGNHSGLLPWDAYMLTMALLHNHTSPRRVRYLALDCLRYTPNVRDVICSYGGVPATFDTALKLLADNELVCFYPEGRRGPSKTFSMRYKLASFNPGFVKAAIVTGSPIIPITIVGGDEIYPVFTTLKSVARILQAPYYAVTLTFPWLPFPFSFIPLPIKWLIKVGKPIQLNYPKEKAFDRKFVIQIAREIQCDIQRELELILSKRVSPFAGWNADSLRSLT